MDYEITYSTNATSEGFTMSVAVSAAVAPLLTVGSNADDPGTAPVGTFSAPPAVVRTDAFVQAAWRLIQNREPSPARALPGQVVRRVMVRSGATGQQERFATETSAPDLDFAATETAAFGLARALRQHPREALSGRTTFRPRKPDLIEATVELTNVGIAPLAIPHPDAWEGRWSFTLSARRNDLPLAELRNEHQRFVELAKGDLADTKPPLAPGAPITLSPGGRVTFTFATVLALPSGGYDVWTTVETPILDSRGTTLLRAEIVSTKWAWKVP